MAKYPQGTGIFFIDVSLNPDTNKFNVNKTYAEIVDAFKQGAFPILRWFASGEMIGNLYPLSSIDAQGVLSFDGKTIKPDGTVAY